MSRATRVRAAASMRTLRVAMSTASAAAEAEARAGGVERKPEDERPKKQATNLRVDVWSDIACPWCYVGKRRLEAALAAFPHADEVEVVWRAFELDPSAPRERDTSQSYAARLATKYRSSVADAEGMIARMTDVAREDGLDFRFDRIRPGNTFDAHRVLHLASERGRQDAVKERFLRAYMTDGEPIGDPETLVRLASDAGLDPDEVRAALASDAYAREVRGEESDASELGIQGVPFFVIGGKYAVSGAQPAEILRRALELAWRELAAEKAPVVFAQGAACGPEGCS
jgi:predicted DsbA family dithiol-disulfide isomerase